VIKKFVLGTWLVLSCEHFETRAIFRAVSARRLSMPLHESEAIILQSYSLGEADRLVSFLSRTMGRVRGAASGARRTKSRFGSTLERLSHVRMWFFEKETRELVRINQTELIESFIDAFSDLASSVSLSILSEVTEAVLPEHEPSDAHFRLLLLSARAIKRTRRPELPLAYFSLWTVKLSGWLPALGACARCRRAIAPTEIAYFSREASEVLCSRCRTPALRLFSSAAYSAARTMLTEKLDRISEENLSPRAARELSDVMLDVIENQIDRKLVSRELLESPAP
jgi:DNA repair protein RecO (recombination protein O)